MIQTGGDILSIGNESYPAAQSALRLEKIPTALPMGSIFHMKLINGLSFNAASNGPIDDPKPNISMFTDHATPKSWKVLWTREIRGEMAVTARRLEMSATKLMHFDHIPSALLLVQKISRCINRSIGRGSRIWLKKSEPKPSDQCIPVGWLPRKGSNLE